MSVQIERSGIEVREIDENEREDWNDYVERSPQSNPFHRFEALDVLAEHSRSTLHPLVGFKGQEPVGLFPLFSITRGPVTTVFSPPPHLHVPYLGPVLLNYRKLKQRKAERRHRRFIEGCLAWMDAELNPKYTHLRTDGRYDDLRPLMWNGFEIDLSYTYTVDLTPGEEEVMMGFSSDARSNIRSGEDADFVLEEGSYDAIRHVVGQVRSRYRAQDKQYGVTPSFVTALYDRLPDGRVRPYALSRDGQVLGGMVVLEHGDTVYRWQGGAKTDVDLPVNDLVDWRIIRDAIDRDVSTYDLVGANKRRLCEYKAKFGPTLRTYHSVERGTRSMNVVSNLYKRFR